MSDQMLEEGTEVLLDFHKLKKIIISSNNNDVIPVVVQDAVSKEVLILAYANEAALDYALKNKVAAFWSTSRNELWVKGATSGSFLELVEVRVNCEQNSLLYLVKPLENGGACHTKEKDGGYRTSCFYRVLAEVGGSLALVDKNHGGKQ
jgi:phosphoribosyl-AMP cyclohydrolase